MKEFETKFSQWAQLVWSSNQSAPPAEFVDKVMEKIAVRKKTAVSQKKIALWEIFRASVLRPVPILTIFIMVLVVILLRGNFVSSGVRFEIVKSDLQSNMIDNFKEITRVKKFTLSAGEYGLLQLQSGGLQILLNEKSDGELSRKNVLQLRQGELWAFADHRAQGFYIYTPLATAVITGTIFGINIQPGLDEFRVTKGQLTIYCKGKKYVLSAGMRAEVKQSDTGKVEIFFNSDTSEAPEWARKLYLKYQLYYFSRYFPSTTRN
ncbi:MAG: FecR family protein [Candidatus Sumerlaeia bacterium]|nr:FecR family protein [Candidatus Sumerlaeia bacterium]